MSFIHKLFLFERFTYYLTDFMEKVYKEFILNMKYVAHCSTSTVNNLFSRDVPIRIHSTLVVASL